MSNRPSGDDYLPNVRTTTSSSSINDSAGFMGSLPYAEMPSYAFAGFGIGAILPLIFIFILLFIFSFIFTLINEAKIFIGILGGLAMAAYVYDENEEKIAVAIFGGFFIGAMLYFLSAVVGMFGHELKLWIIFVQNKWIYFAAGGGVLGSIIAAILHKIKF